MQKFATFSLALILSFPLFSQQTIEGTIKGYEEKQLLFSSIYGHLESAIDTLETDGNGHFEAYFPKDASHGLYRLNFRTQDYMDLIFTGEDIIFKTDITALIDSLNVIQSEENELYYNFYKGNKQSHYKMELLTPLLKYYPSEDTFFVAIVNKFKQIQSELISKIEEIQKKHKNTYACKLIASERDPTLYWNPMISDQKTYLQNHFLDYIDFNDIDLLHSDLFPSKVIQFISVYGDKNLDKEEQGQKFIKAIDLLLSEASVNKVVFDYVFEYVVDGFERFDYEDVMTHLSETYINEENCQDDEDKEKLKKRIEKYKQLSIGKVAPEFELKNTEGETVKLSEVDSEYTLLLFWAGWCSHCEESLPKIHALYDMMEKKKMKVIAISLDKKRSEWVEAIVNFPEDWINVSQLKGWDSPITELYNIYATPSMLLLDKNKKILAKPENTKELENAMIKENMFF